MSAERLSPAARRAMVSVALSALGTGFTLPFLLIYLSAARGIPLATVGLIIAAQPLVSLCVTPIGGALIDRYGPRNVLLLCCVGQAAASASIAGVHTAPQALLAVVTLGAFSAPAWPAGTALLAGLVPAARRPRAFATQFAVINLGIGMGGAVSGLMVDVRRPGTFVLIYLVDAASFLVEGVVLLGVPSVRVPKEEQVAAGGYREVLADRTFRRFAGTQVLTLLGGYAAMTSGIPAFTTGVAHVSTRILGFAFAANTAVIVATQLRMERRLQGRLRTRCLATVSAIWATSWLVFGASALLPGAALPGLAVILGLALFAVGETVLAPVAPALVNDLAPDALRGRYNALSAMTWNMTHALGPVMAGTMLGADLGAAYIGTLVGICAAAAWAALRLGQHLSPAQNGVQDDPRPTT